MSEYLKSECSHCGQPVEYPSEGTGLTVPCPTCNQSFILTPANQRVTTILAPPVVPPAPASEPPISKLQNPPLPKEAPLEQACREFEADREFEKRQPTREQVARAWALAKFNQSNSSASPTHSELIAALKKLFSEFRKR